MTTSHNEKVEGAPGETCIPSQDQDFCSDVSYFLHQNLHILSSFAQTWVSIPWPFASDWECISSPQSSRVLLLNCHAGKDPQNCSVYLKWPTDRQAGELLYYMHWKLFRFVISHPSTILIYNNNLLSFYYVPGTVLRYLHDFEFNPHINPT